MLKITHTNMNIEDKLLEIKKVTLPNQYFTKNILLNKLKGTPFRRAYGRYLSGILSELFEMDLLDRVSSKTIYFKGLHNNCMFAYKLK